MTTTHRIAVFGAGSWGTALAIRLARRGHHTMLWGRNAERIVAMERERCNSRYLPDVTFPENLTAVSSITRAMEQAVHHVLIAVPSEAFRDLLKRLKPHIKPDTRVIWATKGFESGTGRLLHELISEELGDACLRAIISGPTFAREVAQGLPTAMTVASDQAGLLDELAGLFHGNSLRMYTSEDLVGVELGGAVKNVLAIAAGISDGLGFGANARAALITRGLAEIVRLGASLGAQRETMMGLTGLGDLLLTCTDDQSRNRRYGLARGSGKSHEAAISEIGQVVEGAVTAGVIMQVARRAAVEMPICAEVYKIIYKGLSPQAAVADLLGRSLKAEY